MNEIYVGLVYLHAKLNMHIFLFDDNQMAMVSRHRMPTIDTQRFSGISMMPTYCAGGLKLSTRPPDHNIKPLDWDEPFVCFASSVGKEPRTLA